MLPRLLLARQIYCVCALKMSEIHPPLPVTVEKLRYMLMERRREVKMCCYPASCRSSFQLFFICLH